MFQNPELDETACGIFEHAHDAVVILQDCFFVSFNTNFELLTGYSRDDLLNASAAMIIHPDDWAGIYALYRKRIAGEECPRSYSTRIIRKSGEMRQIHLNASQAVWKGSPAVLYFIADTTELWETEGKLEETDRKYRFVVENASEGIFVIQEGMVRFVNPKITELTGYPAEHLYSRPFIEFVHPSDRDHVRRNMQRILDHEGTAVHGGFRFVDAAGAVRAMNLSGVSFRWEGKPATLNFVRDVTDFKETLEERRNIEEKFKKIVEIAQEGILVMDPVGTITYANPYLAGLLGYAPEGMVGRSFLDFLSEADTKIVPPALVPGNLTTRTLYEFVFNQKDGNRIFANLVISPICDFKGRVTGSVAVVSDITERKSAENALRQSREELERERDKLLSILNTTNDGVCIISQNDEVTYCNPVMIRDFGPGTGNTCHAYIMGQAQRCEGCQNPLIHQGTSIQRSWTNPSTKKIYDVFESPLRETSSGVSKLVIFHDITTLKEVEKNLAQSEAKLATILQGLPVAALMIDTDHRIVHWNHALEVLTGTSSDEIRGSGDSWRLALYPEKRPILADIVLEKRAEDLQRWYGDKVHESRRIAGAFEVTDFFPHIGDGGKWLRGTARTIHDAGGTVIGAVETIEDLTEQKVMEQAVVKEKNRARNLLDIAGVMILALDTAGKVTLINQKGCEILGCSKEDILGKDWADTFLPERVRTGITSIFSSLIRGDLAATGRHENPVITCRGEERIISWSNTVIRDTTGRITGTLSSGEDITERTRAEDALRESEQHLRRFFESGLIGVVYWNTHGQITDANARFLEMVGYSRDDLVKGQVNWVEMTPPEYRHLDAASAMELRSTGVNRVPFEKEYIRRDGSRIPVLIAGAMLDGERTNGVAFVLDITERKRAEEALRENELLYRSLFENMLNGFAYCRMEYENGQPRDFTYLAVNYAFASLTGLTDVVGKKVSEVIPGIRESDPELFAIYNRVAQTGVPDRFEIFVEALQMWFAVAVYSPRKGDFVAVFDVISERKRAEEELRRNHAELHAAYEQLTRSEDNLRKNQRNLANAMDIAQIVNWEFDVASGVFTFNDRFYALYGTTAEREGGYQMPAAVYVREFVHPDDIPFVTQVIADVTSLTDPNFSMQLEHRILRRDGTVRHIVVRYNGVLDAQGNLARTYGANQDITDRVQMEDALRTSEKKYRFLIDNISDVVWAVTPDLRLTFVSNSVEKLTGRTVGEVMGKSILEFLTDASVAFVRERNKVLQDRVAGDGTIADVFEVEMFRKDGGTRWAEVSSTSVVGQDGKISGFQGIMRDVTDRHEAQKALLESEEKFRDIFDKANDGIFIHEPQESYAPGRLLEVNETACRMLQYDRSEIVGHSPLEFGTAFFSKPTHFIDEELRSRGYTTFETQQKRKNGEIFPVEISSHVITLQGKQVVLSIIRDITERKRSLEALRASDEKFRAISETALDAVFVKDAQRMYTHVNPAMERMFGINAADILGKTADEVFEPETSRQMRTDDERVLAGEIVEGDITVSAGSRKLVLHAIRVPMRDTDEHIIGICGIARDITERKKTEEQVLASLREKEVLLKEIHHRVKNNMQVISSLLNLQARESSDPLTMSVLRESQSRVKSMALVHEKMYQSHNLAAIEFGDYVRSLVPNLIHQFGKKNVSCSIEADPIHLEVDTAIPCGLIVNELVTNALKHAFPDGKGGTIGITFRSVDDRTMLLTVRDNGVGFPPGIDFRNTTSLGMKLVNSLVRQIGGTIDMIAGTETTFSIAFPRTEK